MIRKYGTINEEVNRIKSLFGESRLYGNLITEGDIEVDIGKELTDMENSQAVITARNNEYNKKIHLLITKNGERDKWGGVRQEPETAKEILKILNEWLVELEKDTIEFESRKRRLSSHESYDLYIWELKSLTSPHINIYRGITLDVAEVIRNWGKVLKELEGNHTDDNTEVVGKSDEELMKDIGDSPGGNLNNELGVFDFNEWQISHHKHFVSEEWKHTVERYREDGYVIEDISNYTKEEKEYLKQCFLIENRQNEEGIVKINNVFNPEESEKTVTTNSSTGGADEKSGTEEETVNQTDTNGKKTGVWETKHKNGKIKERGEYEDDKRVGEWKFYDKSGKLTTTGEYVNGIAEGEWITTNWDGVEMTAKFKNGNQIITLDVDIKEEDIIRDYKNKKYNIGKFVYDKKNDEFKIKSKYPFLLKRTNGVVENMRTTFWETLSKWYDYPLTANNTSLEVVNNKKFKVTTK